MSLNEFVDDVVAALTRLDGEGAPVRSAAHRREICAAVSATMAAALDASTLTPEERQQLQPLLHDVLSPYWTKHCAADAEAAPFIKERAEHYLATRVTGSQVKTAVNLVAALLEALEVPAERRAGYSKILSPAFAHRLVGGVYHLNDARTRYGLQLSLFATLATMLQLSISYDPILRAFRIN